MNKRNRVLFILLMLLVLAGLLIGGSAFFLRFDKSKEVVIKEEGKLVITSFYPVYVIAENLLDGAEDVCKVDVLSEPKTGCLHDFQLTPEDLKLLENADMFLINGSGAETFLDNVIKANDSLKIISGTDEINYMASDEIKMHSWMLPSLYKEEVKYFAYRLIDELPEDKEIIEKNRDAYVARIEEVEKAIAEVKDELSAKGIENVIIFHEAYEGLAEAVGLNVSYVFDLDEEREVSSGEVAEVISNIKSAKGAFIIAEKTYGEKLCETIKNEIDVKVLYLDTLNRGELRDKDEYIEGYMKNIALLKEMLVDEAD